MNQTIKLDTRKREGKYGEARIDPLRRGERNNALLTVKICAAGRPYDLSGKTASLVATTAAGKLVGPCPMKVAEAGIARIMLPAALYSAVGAFSGYVEIREGETLVDTTDSFGGKVIECADLDAEQAEEFTPLLGELQNAVAEEAKRAEAEKARAQAESERANGFAEAKQAAQTATTAANDAAAGARDEARSASEAAESANAAAGKAEDAVAKAEAATKTANEANTAATQAVGDAQAAIAEVKATEAKLYPVAENILVRSETGTVAHVEDAFSGATLRKITVEGACKQDGIPSPESPKPIAVVENPVVKVVGRNVLDIAALAKESPEYYKADGDTLTILKTDNRAWTTFAATQELKAGTYILSGDFVELKDIDGNSLSFSVGTTGAPFTLPVDTKVKVKVGYGRASESYPYTTKAMIERSSSASDYAPYSQQSRAFALPAEHPYLAKLPDGTADEIVVDEEGNVELVARVARVLPSEQKIVFVQGGDDFASYVSLTFANDFESQKRLMSSAYEAAEWTKKSGYIYCPQKTSIVIRDNRFTSEAQARELLNGVVVYIAVEPTRYSLGKIEMPKAQDSIVNAWTDAEVTPSTGIWYVRDVAFWLDKAYAHLDSGLFDDADIAEVEELAAAYYDALDKAEEPSDDEVPA